MNPQVTVNPYLYNHRQVFRAVRHAKLTFGDDLSVANSILDPQYRLISNRPQLLERFNIAAERWLPPPTVRWIVHSVRALQVLQDYCEQKRTVAANLREDWAGIGTIEFCPFTVPGARVDGDAPKDRADRAEMTLRDFFAFFFVPLSPGLPTPPAGVPREFILDVAMDSELHTKDFSDSISFPIRFYLRQAAKDNIPVTIKVKGFVDDTLHEVPMGSLDELREFFRDINGLDRD